MKHYTPLRIQPNQHQFHKFMAQQDLSEAAQRSASYYAVSGLFSMAEALWRSLNFHTQESLAVFVDAKQYLTPTQEHDLVSLTSDYVSSLLSASNTQFIINGDSALNDAERAVFSEALKLFHSTASTTAIALGLWPRRFRNWATS